MTSHHAASGFGRSASAAAGAVGVRRVRLVTGLILFTYIGSHLLDHSTGNFSVAWMEAGLVVQKFLWQGMIGFGALYIALLTHYSLGLWAFYQRRHYGWRPAETVQLILGLSIPFLITNHVFATRISLSLYSTEKDYAQELYSFWVKSPLLGVQQFCLLLVAWTHGCIGVYFWLRLKPAVTRFMPALLSVAVLLPVLALLGFLQGGRTVIAETEQLGWRVANLAPWQVGTAAQNGELLLWRERTMLAEASLLVLVLLLRGVRAVRERSGGAIRISYPGRPRRAGSTRLLGYWTPAAWRGYRMQACAAAGLDARLAAFV